eukprot:Gb_21079 [translate_table: standard]
MEQSTIEDSEIWCAASDNESEAEALSLSDLPVADYPEDCIEQKRCENVILSLQPWKYVLKACGVSKTSQKQQRQQQQDFEFSRSNSASREQVSQELCPADDLFYNGQLLPLSSSLRSQSMESKESHGSITQGSNSFPSLQCQSGVENRSLSRDYSRTTSMDSQCSSFCGSISTSMSSGSSRNSEHLDKNNSNSSTKSVEFQNPIKFPKSDSVLQSEGRSILSRAPPPLSKPPKSSIKWQFFTLGLLKTPEMRLDDIRQRQGGSSATSRGMSDRSRPASETSYPNPHGTIRGKPPQHSKERTKIRTRHSENNLSSDTKLPIKNTKKTANEKSVKGDQNPSVKRQEEWKGWRILRPLSAMVSYRNGCRDSICVVHEAHTRKSCNSNNNVDDGKAEVFYSAELTLPVFADPKNYRDSPRNLSKSLSPNREVAAKDIISSGSKVIPNVIKSAVSLCKQCHAIEPQTIYSRDKLFQRDFL